MIYSYYTLSEDSKQKMQKWIESSGIKNPLMMDDLHVTVLHSETPPKNYAPSKEKIVIDKKTYSLDFDNFGSPPALVLKFRNYKLQKLFRNYIKNGAKSDFPFYSPHISLSYDGRANQALKGEIIVPNFNITLEEELSKIEEEVPANSTANVVVNPVPLMKKPLKRYKEFVNEKNHSS